MSQQLVAESRRFFQKHLPRCLSLLGSLNKGLRQYLHDQSVSVYHLSDMHIRSPRPTQLPAFCHQSMTFQNMKCQYRPMSSSQIRSLTSRRRTKSAALTLLRPKGKSKRSRTCGKKYRIKVNLLIFITANQSHSACRCFCAHVV